MSARYGFDYRNEPTSAPRAFTNYGRYMSGEERLLHACDNSDLFHPGALERLEEYEGYRSASPFPHVVFDDLFRREALRDVLQEWPRDYNTMETHDDGTFVRKKTGTTWQTDFGPKTNKYFQDLSGARFLMALERLTGMWGLMGDPYMFGGGLHSTASGGRLAIHADFNKHPRFGLDRRLNMLIYLNEGWTDLNGGHLELWDKKMQGCEVSVLPVFNRTVIFTTSRTSFHGQPNPVVAAPDAGRRSMALYYYSNGRADEGSPPLLDNQHSTLWQERPEEGY